MPNWCYQVLKIKGPTEQLAKFKADMKAADTECREGDEPFTFNLFNKSPDAIFEAVDRWCGTNKNNNTPLTPEQEAIVLAECGTVVKSEVEAYLIKKYGATGWYDWNIKNWGTKWDCGDVVMIQETPAMLHYNFQTAWSPAAPAILSASDKYPDLTFRMTFTEEGQGFAGMVEFKGGDLVDEFDVDPKLLGSGTLSKDNISFFLAMVTMSKEDIARIIGNIQCYEDGTFIPSEFFESIGRAVLSDEIDVESDDFLQQTIKLFDMEFDPRAAEVFGESLIASPEELQDILMKNIDDEELLGTIRRDDIIAPAIKNKEESKD